MNLPELLQSLAADAIVEFFEVDLTAIGGTDVFRFHAGTNALTLPVVWKGLTYQPFPIQADGFERSVRGTLPRPTLHVANVTNVLVPYLDDFQDLVGAKVTRRRTFVRYLDGQPGADPSQHYDDEVYFVERKISDDGVLVTFELASSLDLEGVKLPSRMITVNSCSWVGDYRRGGDCPYVGTAYFNVRDLSVATLALDVCSGTVQGCKARFGDKAVLPFGGFPAARTYKA